MFRIKIITMAALLMCLIGILVFPATALAFNPQPEPPGIEAHPPDPMQPQFEYLYPDLNIGVISPGEQLVHDAIGPDAQLNPMRLLKALQ